MGHVKEHWFRVALRYAVSGGPSLALLGFIPASLDAAWQDKMGWAALWLCVGWVVAVVGTYVAEPLVDAKTKHRILATGLVAIVATLITGATYFYEKPLGEGPAPIPKRTTASWEGQEAITFTEILRSKDCDLVSVDAFSDEVGSESEYLWVERAYPGNVVPLQQVIAFNPEPILFWQKMYFDRLFVTLKDGQKKVVIFDVGRFFMPTDHSLKPDTFSRSTLRRLCEGRGSTVMASKKRVSPPPLQQAPSTPPVATPRPAVNRKPHKAIPERTPNHGRVRLAPSATIQKNCEISGGTNNGIQEQNCPSYH